MLPSDCHINADRLWDSIAQSAAIGTRGNGLSRLALADNDKQMRDLFVQWCSDEGLKIAIDLVGNIFARRAG